MTDDLIDHPEVDRPDIHDFMGWAVYLNSILLGVPMPILPVANVPPFPTSIDEVRMRIAQIEEANQRVFTPQVAKAMEEIAALVNGWAAEHNAELQAKLTERSALHIVTENTLRKDKNNALALARDAKDQIRQARKALRDARDALSRITGI